MLGQILGRIPSPENEFVEQGSEQTRQHRSGPEHPMIRPVPIPQSGSEGSRGIHTGVCEGSASDAERDNSKT